MREFEQVFEALKAQGWKVTQSGPQCKAMPPAPGKPLVHFSTHTSDHHAVKNTLSRLRRSGFEWPPPAKAAADAAPPAEQHSDIEPACAPPSETAGERLERLCRELTEAWGYVALADENLLERREQMEAALRSYQGAQAEHSSAVARFKETKKALDAAVEITPTVGTKSLIQ